MDKENLAYRLGGLLYCPAANDKIAEKIINGAYPCLTSIALCLEDAIADDSVEQAEKILCNTLEILSSADKNKLPLIFIRVRSPEHLSHVHKLIAPYEKVLTGYIFPKFDVVNGNSYVSVFKDILAESGLDLYFMPILESGSVANKAVRLDNLIAIKKITDGIRDRVLNIRVGGNDFSELYGLRRNVTQTVYDIGVIRDILVDIINFFAGHYVVSGVVWEYFQNGRDESWRTGLERELELDKLNGFTGKTAIHPSQLPVIYESLQVNEDDYKDAVTILNWHNSLGVQKDSSGSRMNEVKCHTRWAKKIKTLGDIYGIKGETCKI